VKRYPEIGGEEVPGSVGRAGTMVVTSAAWCGSAADCWLVAWVSGNDV
jgi:hypothetical protein